MESVENAFYENIENAMHDNIFVDLEIVMLETTILPHIWHHGHCKVHTTSQGCVLTLFL